MICDLPQCWEFLTYNGFKSHVNVTGNPNFLAGDRIRVGKEEAGTSAFNQAYDKFQAKQDKAQTSQILQMVRVGVNGRINHCHIIIIVSTSIQNINAKFWTDSFVAVNLHPHRCLSFSDWIKKIAKSVKTGETAYFHNHEGSYYDVMPYIWKNMTLIKKIETKSIIGRFSVDTPRSKSLWTKKNILSLIHFVALD